MLNFTHPEDVLHSRAISVADKRAILASWASDAHAVPNLPAMRQLDSGAIVSIDTVLGALRALDASDAEGPRTSHCGRKRRRLFRQWRGPTRDDDDDPPFCVEGRGPLK